MSDASLLFVVLAVLYIWECACWIQHGSVACLKWFGKRWRVARPGEFIGNQQGGFVFTNPFPPLGSIVTGNQFPLSFSPRGILTWVSPSAGSSARPRQFLKFFPFAEIKTVSVRHRKLFINEQLALKLSSATLAAYVASQIEVLKASPENERAPAIEAMFSESLNGKAVEDRWIEFQGTTRPIRWLANGLVVYLFAFAPAMTGQFGLRATWLALVVGLLALTISLTFFFHRAHKKFFPAAEDDRFTHAVMIALAPATAARTRDILSRPLLEKFHPLAVSHYFCGEEEFCQFAGKVLRDLRHPFQPPCPGENPEWLEAELFSRQTLQRAAEKFLKLNRIDPEKLCAAPKPADDTCRGYCPRCLAQFTTPTGECADCGGMPLMPLVRASVEKANMTNEL